MPEAEDWVALDDELNRVKQCVSDLDAKIADKSKINEQEYKRKSDIQRLIGEKRLELTKRENAIRTEANAGRNEADMKIKELEYLLKNKEAEAERKRNAAKECDKSISVIEDELSALRGKFREINAEVINYPEGAFVCPTCKRPLDADDIEAKQAELLANFNQNKAERLRANQETGKRKAAEKSSLSDKMESLLSEATDLENEITTIKGEIEVQKENIPESQNVEYLISSDQTCIDLKNEISDLTNQLSIDSKPVDVSDLQEKKQAYNSRIQELYKSLAKREQIERAEKEIADLEEKRIANNQALADLEKWEFTALSFQKDKDAKLLERINGLFNYVSFSFVDNQLNGGEKLTCVCTVNGTPYPDVNAAGKLNAGLDIINAICKAKGFSAPIFIDNRESVNRIIPTISQVINLSVSLDKTLTVK